MVSDSELIERLREFLKSSDLETTTTTIVRRKLEEDFGVDLSDKKAFIREQVDLFLQSQLEEEVEGGGDDQKSEENGGDEVEEEEEEADEAEVVKEEEVEGVRPSRKRRSKKPVEEGKKRGGGGGFTKICSLSPQLQEFLGAPEMARTEVVKQLWCYIREKDLQDPSNRKNILCDEPLRALFHVDSINMFQMNKALAKHIWPLDSDDVLPAKTTPKEKQKKQEKEEEPDDSGRKEKRQKGGTSGLMAPIQLSEPLIKFLGTSENALPRSEVVKRMWDYIKQNNLQDPSDKRQVICDEKLKELFDLDSFTGFTVSKLLSAHFVKT
ncbi:Upstream activation factor subunit spp27 [Linum perenne]